MRNFKERVFREKCPIFILPEMYNRNTQLAYNEVCIFLYTNQCMMRVRKIFIQYFAANVIFSNCIQGPVVQSGISANPGLKFNPLF